MGFNDPKLMCEICNKYFTNMVEKKVPPSIKFSYYKVQKVNLDKVDELSKETLEKVNKLEEIKERLMKVTTLYDKCQQDFEILNFRQLADKETLKLTIEENETLTFHLKSNSEQIEDLKIQLNTAHEELETIHKTIDLKRNYHNQTSDYPWISSEEQDFDVNKIIPFEKSLLAELQHKEVSSQDGDCSKCLSEHNLSEMAVSSTSYRLIKCDIAVETEDIDSSTVTALKKKFMAPEDLYPLYCKLCYLNSKRSLKKWTILGIIILLFCFFLGFFSSLASVYAVKCPQPATMCLSSFLRKFKRPTVYKNVKVPIH